MPVDPQRQRQAKEYAQIRHRLWAVNLALTALTLILVMVLGLNVWLKHVVLSICPNVWISTFLYFAIAIVAYELAFFPLAYYQSFVLPHRYGLSTQNLRSWLADAAKGGALMIGLGGLIVEVIYALLRARPDSWWIWATVFMLLVSVAMANLAPILIFPLFFKFKRLDDPALAARLTALAQRARTRVRGVYTIVLSAKTTAANAALMGLGNTRRIVLGDTLYAKYSHDEIETILAHELGHHVHRDIGWTLAIETLLTIAGFYLANLFLKWSAPGLGYAGVADLAAFPLLAIAMGAFGLVTKPLGNAFSRWRERMADDYALTSTGNGPAFVTAMEKLADQNLGELEPQRWVVLVLYDHPPLGQRIARGQCFAATGK